MAEDKDKNEFSDQDDEFDFGPDDADDFGDSDFGALTGGGADSDFGNLPPLTDFESSAGEEEDDADDALPPLGEITSHDDGSDEGGLPAIDDIDVETPAPTGGNIRPAPPGFETPQMNADIDTPEPGFGGTGFQDVGADSDFSPETPDIGPGPDSDIDTPMFDSAFGANQQFEGISDTSTPTQAMETPMFGVSGASPGEAPGFDDGAFGAVDDSAFDQGTPIPDFSPDTGVPAQAPAAETPPGGKKKKAKKVKSGGGGMGGGKAVAIMVVAALVALVAGLVLRPYVSAYLGFLPDPQQSTIQTQRTEIEALQRQVANLQRVQPGDEPVVISQEEVERLLARQAELTDAITELEQTRAQIESETEELGVQLAVLEEDVEIKRDEAREVQEQLEALRNDTTIQRARQEGLNAEVMRLTEQVGQLEEADVRRSATKDALMHNVGRLLVGVREGLPLTPDRYNREARLRMAEALLSEVQNAKWVTPDLLQRYTSLYLRELEIAGAREYFFAKIPVTDRFGTRTEKWAECLMNGNWSVYYRTLDGRNIGIYQDAGTGAQRRWTFREDLSREVQSHIEESVVAHRDHERFEQGVRLLAQKDSAVHTETALQRLFNSL